MDELDRILLQEDRVQPSAGFVGVVMDEVLHGTRTNEPIPFPWHRLLAGLSAGILVATLGVLAADSTLVTGAGVMDLLRDLATRSSLLLLAVVIVSFFSAYLPVRWLEA